jgi:hypothetical protein
VRKAQFILASRPSFVCSFVLLVALLNGVFVTVQVGEMKHGATRHEHCISVAERCLRSHGDVIKTELVQLWGRGLILTGLRLRTKGSVTLPTWHPLSAKVGTNSGDKRRLLGVCFVC